MLSHPSVPKCSLLLQKEESEAAFAAALNAAERSQAVASSASMPAADGNASWCAHDGRETPPRPAVEAPSKLLEAQEALVAADEQARSSKQAFQAAAR